MKDFNFFQEVRRKSVHILAIGYILIYWYFLTYYGKYWGLFALTSLLVLFIVIDFFRVEKEKKIWFFQGFWRKKEKDRFGGNVFFILGAIIAFSVFDYRIAVAGILMTVFGDMIAAIIGKGFGRIKITKEKKMEGMIGELIVDLVIGYFVIGNWIVFIPMALGATIAETYSNKLDDNLVIPVIAGFVGQVFGFL